MSELLQVEETACFGCEETPMKVGREKKPKLQKVRPFLGCAIAG
eukprot:CAMPEP_0198119790 /NCGR_PEP_ID=MMETSP1442-20131203/27000_1 /TAXON_ID= /ORGANISM="Craspedostauros australis, Strain CCMP3328" /LENGTH=43 /DNA_ID= /DNA_START= /DNA_END= /DNA_ORIENTATION=